MNKKIFFTAVTLFFSIISYAQLELKQNTFKQISSDDPTISNMGTNPHLFGEKVKDKDGDLCAILLVKIDKVALSDIKKFDLYVDEDMEIVRKEIENGNLCIYLTGRYTKFWVVHPSFGKSNIVQLKLEIGKTYEIQLTNGETADLSFYSNPAGANIYINGEWKGKTADNGLSVPKLPYGNYTVMAQLNGIKEEKNIEITETSDRSYSFNVMQKRLFYFNSDPQGATLFIDGTKIGTTPLSHELTLEFHNIKATLNGEQDSFDKNFADKDLPNTFTLNVIKKKSVQINALVDGQRVSAKVEIDNKELIDKTPVTEQLTYGKHKVNVQYYGRSKTKNIKVTESGKSHFDFKLPGQSSITWPWEKDRVVYPIGWSLGYVQKQWVLTYENEKIKYGFWDDDKYLHGIQTGLRITPHFWGGIGLNTGLFYEFYYSKSDPFEVLDTEGYGGYGDGYATMMEHSLYLPLNLEYRFQFSESFQIFVNGGIGLDYGLFAGADWYMKSDDSNPYYSESDIYGKEDFGDYTRFNVSAEFGGGIRIRHFQLNFNMAKGLMNQTKEENVTVKQNKMMISASLMY
ncbi:MAG: PEGA domain-containing protein [Dysgonamonadaceae bacterium]|jgi:hypothetical protein|nr:PEGA domain-containing protein [Dysgonamonadaceae bacterium]